MSLFDLLTAGLQRGAEVPPPGSLNIHAAIYLAQSDALRHAGKSREQIADEMTAYIGEEVTVHQLNAWVAPSKDRHRFPLEYLPAFCKATGSLKPLDVVSRACGAFTLRGPDALRADIRKLDEKKKAKADESKALEAEKKRLETLLQEVEGQL